MLSCTLLVVWVFLICVHVCVPGSNANHLLQRWQELKEREHAAHRHNKQLLQQFEKAQDTLREMMTLTAAMKTIRVHLHTRTHTEQKIIAWERRPFCTVPLPPTPKCSGWPFFDFWPRWNMKGTWSSTIPNGSSNSKRRHRPPRERYKYDTSCINQSLLNHPTKRKKE